jgi:RNA polymerase nonessential primary-like sigma factor
MKLPAQASWAASGEIASRDTARQGVFAALGLEIPLVPLLTRKEELQAGRRIKRCLQRLKALLICHPIGYKYLLTLIEESIEGQPFRLARSPGKDSSISDLAISSEALKNAESLAARDPGRALEALAHGSRSLQGYQLNPETIYEWAREISRSQTCPGPLDTLHHTRRVARLLRKALIAFEEAKEKLLLPNLRLVLKEALRYRPVGMNRGDVFQEGILGLHKALLRFEPSRELRFSTYATFWIRNSIQKVILEKSRLVRLPQAIQNELRKQTRREDDPQAKERAIRTLKHTVLFSSLESERAGKRSTFEIKDASAAAALASKLRAEEIPAAVGRALQMLSSRQKDVLVRRFGLAGVPPQTLEEIGSDLALSRERVRQIETEALARLGRRRELAELFEEFQEAEPAALAVS